MMMVVMVITTTIIKYYMQGNMPLCLVGKNVLILQIRKLKLKKTKLLKFIKLVCGFAITTVLENSDDIYPVHI